MVTVSMEGKTCLITGASRGIGKATALKLAEAGLKGMVMIGIHDDDVTKETIAEIESYGTGVHLLIGDAGEEDVVKKAVALMMEQWGRIDVLINNAGVSSIADFEDTTVEQWDRTMHVNLRSTFLTMKYCSEIMKKQRSGSIVNMSSISGITGGNTSPDYGASKAGVIALTQFAAKKLGPYNIRVNCVAPGTIATDMIKNNYAALTEEEVAERLAKIPMRRMGEPEEVGNCFLFLASDMASYVSGVTLEVTGDRKG